MTSVMNVDLTGKRIALIGGAGFIGHNLALTLHSLAPTCTFSMAFRSTISALFQTS